MILLYITWFDSIKCNCTCMLLLSNDYNVMLFTVSQQYTVHSCNSHLVQHIGTYIQCHGLCVQFMFQSKHYIHEQLCTCISNKFCMYTHAEKYCTVFKIVQYWPWLCFMIVTWQHMCTQRFMTSCMSTPWKGRAHACNTSKGIKYYTACGWEHSW